MKNAIGLEKKNELVDHLNVTTVNAATCAYFFFITFRVHCVLSQFVYWVSGVFLLSRNQCPHSLKIVYLAAF